MAAQRALMSAGHTPDPAGRRSALLLALLALFALALAQLDRSSIWTDEAWSIWVAQQPWPRLFQTVAADVHPPLYFALLKPWLTLTGESAFATRWLSAGFGLLGLTLTYSLGRRLLDGWAALLAVIWLGSHGFLLYYLREARMYSLLFAAAALSMWFYWQWLARPTRAATLGLIAATVALAYSHYFGVLIPLTQGLQLGLTQPRRLPRWLVINSVGGLLALPVVLIAGQQWLAHPSGAHLATTPTDWNSLRQLWIILSGGGGLLVLAPLVLGRALPYLWQRRQAFLLLGLWLVVTPGVLLVVNGWLLPVYEARYAISGLPAMALLVGAGLRFFLHWGGVDKSRHTSSELANPSPAGWHSIWGNGFSIVALGLLVAVNLAAADQLRPPKAPWAATIAQVLALRQAGEPTLLKIVEPGSLEAYFSRTMPLRNEATIELADEPYSPAALAAQLRTLPADKPIWLLMPHNIGETWVAVAELSRSRRVGFRRSVDHMLFYRFDPAVGDELAFHFGQLVAFQGTAGQLRPAQAGDSLCFEVPLQALGPVAEAYSYGVHLVDGSGRLVAQLDQGLGSQPAGAVFQHTACLTLPTELAPAPYSVQLLVYTWVDGRRLPVYEATAAWGDVLVLAVVMVRGSRLEPEDE
jgi:hypothetical protein